MRVLNFTFVNSGSTFVFRTDKMTRHPYQQKGATMLQVHALLTLDGKESGLDVDLYDAEGVPLTIDQLRECAATGNPPSVTAVA